MNHDIPHDLPIQVKIPLSAIAQPPVTVEKAAGNSSEPATTAVAVVRAVIKYNNDEGREAILSMAKTVHHDFGLYNSSLSVSLTPTDLDVIKKNPNVDWFEGDGRVIYCSIR